VNGPHATVIRSPTPDALAPDARLPAQRRADRRRGEPRPGLSAGTRVVLCNWRDLRHPEGGGSEFYVEMVARALAARGAVVTMLSARVAGAPGDEVIHGVHHRRRGGVHTVYLAAAWQLLTRRVRADVVVDVQNGVPFLSPLVSRRPVVALVHHVHREQWPLVFGPVGARLGWFVESRLAPMLYRRSRYLTVSRSTAAELHDLGVARDRIAIAHNGTAVLPSRALRSPTPRVLVLNRLVPHKRVEMLLEAAAALRARHPELRVDVVGRGYWAPRLLEDVARLGLQDLVTLHGHVDEQTKADLQAQAWVNAVPSVKEGWGLSVVEAGAHGTPSLAFANAGGVAEAVRDGVTGVLVVGGQDEFTAALGALLDDGPRRSRLGNNARVHALRFGWDATVDAVVAQLVEARGGEDGPISGSRTPPRRWWGPFGPSSRRWR